MSASSPRRLDGLRATAPAAVLVVLALTTSACLRPAAAGDLNDFLKKGGSRPSGGSSGSSGSSGSNNSKDRTTPAAPSRDDRPDIFSKGPRDSTGPSDTSGSNRPANVPSSRPSERQTNSVRGKLWDIFNKRAGAQPLPRSDAGSGSSSPGTTAPQTSPSGGGGLFDIFRKPAKAQPQRPFGVPVPPTVVYHYYDPWYYPYDRVFYDNYCPYLVRYPRVVVADPEDQADREEESAVKALREIEKGWEQKRFRFISRYVDPDGMISISKDGRFSHVMSPREFEAMTTQAFDDVRTVRFRFYSTHFEAGQVRAEGEHVFVGPDGEERRVEVVYTLIQRGRRWIIDAIDLRQQSQIGALERVLPQGPAISVASLDTPVVVTDVDLPGLFVGRGSRPLVTEPAEPLPPFLACGLAPTVSWVEDRPLAFRAEARRLAAAEPSQTPAQRVVCVATPVRSSALRVAKKPLRAATVTYRNADGSAAVYDVQLSPARDGGLSWCVAHRGERQARTTGAVPAARLKGAGSLRIEIGRSKTPHGLAPGEQCLDLFTHPSWDFRVVLLTSPKPLPTRSVRTELLVDHEPQG